MKHSIENGIHSIGADPGKEIVNKNDYARELSGEIIRVEVAESCYASRLFSAPRYSELILGKNDVVENYVEIDQSYRLDFEIE